MSEDGEGAAIRYVPAVAAEWDLDAPGDLHRELDATMCFVDISGFTNLSERLAARGRIGAEELTEVLGRVFGSMISLAHERGGNLVKFGGDALLLLFYGDGHVEQACGAAVEMRVALRESAQITTSVGRVPLKMSVGLHTGTMHAYLVGDSHRELIVTGPGATGTIEMEATADAGQIVVSRAVRDALPRGAATVAKGDGWVLKWRKAPVAPVGARPRRDVPIEAVVRCIPVGLRDHLQTGEVEPEHRVGVVGFVKYKGVDDLHHRLGPDAVAAALDEVTRVVQRAAEDEGICFLASDIDADGGKFILTAGVPTAVEDDEGRMLRALRVVADAGTTLPIKIGVNRGHVFAGEIGARFRSTYTVMGDTVNLAARLMAAAPAGAIYATPAVLDRSATMFETAELEPFSVKGKSAKVHADGVGAEGGDRDARPTDELPFVGRDAELAVLQTALARLESDGVGGVVELVGEVGAGKTRLVDEATAGLSTPIVTIRGESYASATPYRAFRDPVRRFMGAAKGGPDGQHAALRDRVRELAPHLEPLLPLVGRVAHIDVPPTPQS
ncbi:MAG: adenylate/guanylate cyclase domain-containing protein, partial [Acidimicrobiales bacterium]